MSVPAAVDAIERALNASSPEYMGALATIAVAEATLALVEQQRLANRIAVAALLSEVERAHGQHGSRVGLVHEAGICDYPEDVDGVPPLQAAIREGLGLS